MQEREKDLKYPSAIVFVSKLDDDEKFSACFFIEEDF